MVEAVRLGPPRAKEEADNRDDPAFPGSQAVSRLVLRVLFFGDDNTLFC